MDETPEIESYYFVDNASDASDAPIGSHDKLITTALSPDPLLLARSSKERGGPSTLVRSPSSTIPSLQPLWLTSGQRHDHVVSPSFSSLAGDEQDIEYQLPISPMSSNERGTQPVLAVKSHCDSDFQPRYATQPVSSGSNNSCILDSGASAVQSPSQLSPSIWKKQFFWPDESTTTQSICLVRYFVRELAPWVSAPSCLSILQYMTILIFALKFDVCDPGRHFTLEVPERARRCPPLLYAIFTVAARHLANSTRYSSPEGVITYKGIRLPNLTANTAIEYHNACIAYLLEVSHYPEHMHDENLLATAVLLRFYEVLDTPAGGEDEERFLHTFQSFTTSQASIACLTSTNEQDMSLPRTLP